MLIFLSKFTKNLNKIEIKKILILKKSFWKFSYKSQFEYFEKNIFQNDVHNMVYLKKKLIGYTLLRKRRLKKKYLIFDTLIIDKNFRKKKIASKLMKLNMEIIKKYNFKTILICEKRLINFYKKFKWKLNNRFSSKKVLMTANKRYKPIKLQDFLDIKETKRFF